MLSFNSRISTYSLGLTTSIVERKSIGYKTLQLIIFHSILLEFCHWMSISGGFNKAFLILLNINIYKSIYLLNNVRAFVITIIFCIIVRVFSRFISLHFYYGIKKRISTFINKKEIKKLRYDEKSKWFDQ